MNIHRLHIRKTSVVLLFAAAAVMLICGLIPVHIASAATCAVCHKRTQSIPNMACNGLDYRRHKDHGDPDGLCAATQP